MSVVDQDREESRALRRDQPTRALESWYGYGHRVSLAIALGNIIENDGSHDHASEVHGWGLALIRGAIDGGHMTDTQIGELARGVIAGLRDAGLAPEAVEA